MGLSSTGFLACAVTHVTLGGAAPTTLVVPGSCLVAEQLRLNPLLLQENRLAQMESAAMPRGGLRSVI